MKLLPKVAFVQ